MLLIFALTIKNKEQIMKKVLLLALSGLVLSTGLFSQNVSVDGAIPSYSKKSGISGSLNSIGSDSLINLMAFWSEGFKKNYPGVKFQIEGKGSSTAPPALIEGSAQFGPMSRKMKSSEVEAFVKKYGYKPTEIVVAIDTLAVFVSKDNPLKSLSLPQIDAIFSKTRNSKYPKEITLWNEIGLSGAYSNKPISLYGRNSASGTYGYFKEHALYKGDFKNTVKEQPGSASVVQGVEKDKFAIGYSGFGYKTSGVKAIDVAPSEGAAAVEANYQNALSGKYPLSRHLYIYVNKAPGKAVDPAIKEFIAYVLSKEGQQIVVKDGYFPLTANMAKQQLDKLK